MDSLFPKTRQNILSTLLVSPERRWYISDLARLLNVTPSSLQRELANMSNSGLLLREEDGNRVYYQANQLNPIFADLQNIFIKTTGLAEPIREALQPFETQITIAFIFGSTARKERRPESDIDLLIIGEVGMAELALPLRGVERILAAPINVVQYTLDEFKNSILLHNHFLETILSDQKIFLKGTPDELAKIIDNAKAEAA